MMLIILLLVFAAGCLGGAIGVGISAPSSRQGSTGESRGKLQLFTKNTECDTYFATRIGNTFLGGLSAVVFWGLYGPFSAFPVLGESQAIAQGYEVFLSLGDLVGSFLVGTGGPAFVLAESKRRCLRNKVRKLKSERDQNQMHVGGSM